MNSIHGLKVLEADTPLLPTQMLIKEEAHLNPPSNDLLSAEKSIRSFLMVGRPDFGILRLMKGCGSKFCDSIHIEKPSSRCPALTGTRYSNYCIKATFKSNDIIAKIFSQSLAEFFIAESTLQLDEVNLNGFEDFVHSVMSNCNENSWLIGGWMKLKFQEDAPAADEMSVHISVLKCITDISFQKFAGGVESEDDSEDCEDENIDQSIV